MRLRSPVVSSIVLLLTSQSASLPWLGAGAALTLVGLQACGGGDDTTAAAGALGVAPETLAFGVVGVGQSADLAITLTNEGTAPIDILSVSLVSGDSRIWHVDKGDLTSLAGGASADVIVTFAPDEEVAFGGSVQIRSSAAENADFTVALTGLGGPNTADEDGDGYSSADGDCDDGNGDRHPGAKELCNGVDDDCNDAVPSDETDGDGDGFRACNGECDDADGNVYPGAPEICDDKDSDCAGGPGDHADADGDGYAICDGDCAEGDPAVHPDVVEICDGIDNDCDLTVDMIDDDADGHSLCSDAGDCDDHDPTAFPVVVATNGSATGTGTDADPYDTIATALANLDLVCRTVYVAAGSYTVAETWGGGDVSIVGTGAKTSDVTLTAAQYSRHFDVTAGSSLTLEHLTLTGGDAASDGGAVRGVNADLTLDDVAASANASAADGGAVAATGGSLTLRGGCTFDGNSALDDGGAVSVSGAAFSDHGGTVYTNNSGSSGGAIYVVGGSAAVEDVTVDTNTATEEGGGIAISGGGSFTLEGGDIWRNTAGTLGGGVALRDVNDPGGYLRNFVIADNVAGTGGGGMSIHGAGADFTVSNNSFTANEATAGEGGGLLCDPAAGLALQIAANLVTWSKGASGLWNDPASGALIVYNSAFATSAGAASDLVGLSDPSNHADENPLFTTYTDDGNPANDDLSLLPGSPAIDSGPSLPSFDDPDGSQNDRGATGGPGAP